MGTPAQATGPAKRTLSNTVASLAAILDILAQIVLSLEHAKQLKGKTPFTVSVKDLNASATAVRSSARTAESASELKEILFTGITRAETTIAQLRLALAPSFSQRLRNGITFPSLAVRRLLKRPHHFTYAEFYQESARILAILRTSRKWIERTSLRRRAPAPTHNGPVPFVVAHVPTDTLVRYEVMLESEQPVSRAGPTPRGLTKAPEA